MAYESYGFNQNKTKKDISKLDIDYIESLIESRISNIQNDFLMKMYPVNSLYFSPVNKNPASVLGFGTWSSYSDAQRFLVITPGKPQYSASADVGNMKTGGSNMLTLKDENLPPHAHAVFTEDASASSQTPLYPTWRRLRIIRRGSGLWTGDYDYRQGKSISSKHAGFKFWVRRGKGSGTVTVGNSVNFGNTEPQNTPGGCVVSRQDWQAYSSDQRDKMDYSFETHNDHPDQYTDTRMYPDSVQLDITANCRVEGFTDTGIYNEGQYNVSINNAKWTPLSQKQIDNRPAYITVYCWIRTA